MSECCKTGFSWGGSPVGKEATLGKNPAYVTGTNKERAVLIIHDVWGWKFNNTRLLADHYAKEADATVYLPDYFDGEDLRDTLSDPEKAKSFDLGGFIGRNSKDIRGPEIFEGAKTLKSQYKKVGAIGFCYGGWAVYQLGGKGQNLVDCIATAHPSILTKEEMSNVAVPNLIMAPENDPQLTPELKEYANTEIPKLGVDYVYSYYPGINHGFATKGDEKDPKQKEGLERAKREAVNWFVQYLHE